MRGLRFKDLTPLCRSLPDYDGHFVPGLVDANDNPVLGTFVHRLGSGIPAVVGGIATCGGGIRWKRECMHQTDLDAFTDGLRLPIDMSKKSAGLNEPLGGAKTVVFGHNIPPADVNSAGFCTWTWETREEIWKAMAGEIMSRVPGYVAAEDSGTTVDDAKCLKKHAPQAIVAGITKETDSSPTTADGLMIALEATQSAFSAMYFPVYYFAYAIQGIGGAVASALVKRLDDEYVGTVVGCDTSPQNLEKVLKGFDRVKAVDPKDIYQQDVDVFMPCAFGGTLNKDTIPLLKARMVVGCANNQLSTPEDGRRLHERKILYAPAYIANAGGMAMVFTSTITGGDLKEMLQRIGTTLTRIYDESRAGGMPTSDVADAMVAQYIKEHMSLPR